MLAVLCTSPLPLVWSSWPSQRVLWDNGLASPWCYWTTGHHHHHQMEANSTRWSISWQPSMTECGVRCLPCPQAFHRWGHPMPTNQLLHRKADSWWSVGERRGKGRREGMREREGGRERQGRRGGRERWGRGDIERSHFFPVIPQIALHKLTVEYFKELEQYTTFQSRSLHHN